MFCTRAYFGAESVVLCDASDVLSGYIFRANDIFIMPGGADIPYGAALNGTGNQQIRDFVTQGGTYLGLCAGAYYGSRAIAYHQGRSDEICEPRELAFIDALAYGSLPAIAGYYDATLATACWTTLIDDKGNLCQSFYNGGCAFELNDEDARILARYTDLPGQPAAIIEKSVGAGRVLLSGVHCEIRPDHLRQWSWDSEDEERRARELANHIARHPFSRVLSGLFQE